MATDPAYSSGWKKIAARYELVHLCSRAQLRNYLDTAEDTTDWLEYFWERGYYSTPRDVLVAENKLKREGRLISIFDDALETSERVGDQEKGFLQETIDFLAYFEFNYEFAKSYLKKVRRLSGS